MTSDAERYFDPSLAELPTRILAVGQVVDLLPDTHAPQRVEAYRSAMSRGDRFPPISVIRLGGRFVVADGHKRLTACKTLGAAQIVVEVWPPRRWLQDQWRQAKDNGRKNQKIVTGLVADPRESARLLIATLGHWRRVAAALLRMALGINH